MAQTVGTGKVVGLLLSQLAVAVTEGAGLGLLVPVLQSLSGRDDLTVPGLGAHLSVVGAFTLVLIVVVLRAVATWRVAVASIDIRLKVIDLLRLELLDDLYRAQWRYLAAQRRSHVVQRLTTEVERAHSALITLLKMIISGSVLTVTVVVAVILSPGIGSATAAVLVLVAVIARRSVRASVRLGQRMNDRTESLGAAISDSLASIRLIRAHDASAAWSAIVADEARRFRQLRRSFVLRSSGVMAALSVVVVVAVLGLVLVGRAAGLGFAALAALAVIATRILNSAQALVGSAQQFANDAPALDRLGEFGRDAAGHRERSRPAVPAPAVHVHAPLLELRNVTVRYRPDAEPALAGVDLCVPAGGLVTVTGGSGSGKSTLLDVVLGLLPPDVGRVLVEGAPVAHLPSWRARVGYVPQQTVLVPGTVQKNLEWSLPPGRTVTEDELRAALAAACVDDVVDRLSDGIATPLREFAELSGGEQQRLSIARALLRRPDLLLLDEATSALDAATEQRVLHNLLDGTRAVILVTHRVTPFARSQAVAALHLQNGTLEPRKDAVSGTGGWNA